MTRNKLLEFIDFGNFGVVEQFFSVLKTKGSRINFSATSEPFSHSHSGNGDIHAFTGCYYLFYRVKSGDLKVEDKGSRRNSK